jgi:hypothetical protein
MKLIIEMELTEQEANYILSCSIERVMNNAINIGSKGEKELKLERDRENASVLWQDCEDAKPVTTKMWNTVRNAVFIERNKK